MAAEPAGFQHWKGAELKDKTSAGTLASFSNHSVMLARREASGEAEIHEGMVDIFIVQSGEADLVVGGKILGAKTTAPGEQRGTGIAEGQKTHMEPGDVVHIPAGTPHQVLLRPGMRFAYLVVKIAK